MKSQISKISPGSNLVLPVAKRDHVQGPIDAPFSLLEYGDYECPYCGDAHPAVKAIQRQLGNRLCFAFRNFPLVNSHPHAEHAAEAVEAAGAQGKFWEMHDMLFENQNALEDEDLARYAEELSLDGQRLIKEVAAGANSARVREDLKNGERDGVNGTPTFFVNGALYDGEPEVAALYAALTNRNPM